MRRLLQGVGYSRNGYFKEKVTSRSRLLQGEGYFKVSILQKVSVNER